MPAARRTSAAAAGTSGRRLRQQVPAQEGQLGLDGLLVAAQERLVVPAGHPDEFAARRAFRRADGGPGQGRLVLVAGQDQQRAPDPGRVPAGPVETEAERRAGGDLLLPVRVSVVWIERAVAVEAVRRREHRDGARRPGERHQPWLAAKEAADGVDDAPAGEAKQRDGCLVPRRVARRGRAVDVRRLGDCRGQGRVARRDVEDVAAEAEKPQIASLAGSTPGNDRA